MQILQPHTKPPFAARLRCLLAMSLLACDPGGADDSAPGTSAAETGGGTGDDDAHGSSSTDRGEGDSGSDGTVDEESGDGSDDGTTPPVDGIVDLELGARFGVAVHGDGSVYAWGEVPSVPGVQPTPVKIDAITDAVAVTVGAEVFVLRQGGSFVRFAGMAEPEAVDLDDVHAVDSGFGGAHCAIAGADRQLYCWGFSGLGVLGFDPEENPEAPTAVPGMTAVAQVSVGDEHTCARLESGAVQCTGRGNSGQLGDGAFDSSRVGFADVLGPADFVQIDSGRDSTCGLRQSGEMVCWGWLWHTGGVGTPTAPVADIPGATGVFANDHIQCAFDGGGLSCWGYGPGGGVGNGQTWIDMAQETPFAIDGLPPIAGGNPGSCVHTTEGEVYCWGSNDFGETGTGLPDTSVLQPTLVAFGE